MANLRPAQHAGSSAVGAHLPSYITGYIDGEGCFTVSISPRPTLRVGWEVRPSLSVSQNGDRAEVILAIQDYFGCGSVRPDRSDKTVKWEIRSLSWLLHSVIPHFARYPLLSGKRRDFELFADICRCMDRREHLEPAGLAAIVEMAAGMNPSGKRGYEPAVIISQLQKMKA